MSLLYSGCKSSFFGGWLHTHLYPVPDTVVGTWDGSSKKANVYMKRPGESSFCHVLQNQATHIDFNSNPFKRIYIGGDGYNDNPFQGIIDGTWEFVAHRFSFVAVRSNVDLRVLSDVAFFDRILTGDEINKLWVPWLEKMNWSMMQSVNKTTNIWMWCNFSLTVDFFQYYWSNRSIRQ